MRVKLLKTSSEARADSLLENYRCTARYQLSFWELLKSNVTQNPKYIPRCHKHWLWYLVYKFYIYNVLKGVGPTTNITDTPAGLWLAPVMLCATSQHCASLWPVRPEQCL